MEHPLTDQFVKYSKKIIPFLQWKQTGSPKEGFGR